MDSDYVREQVAQYGRAQREKQGIARLGKAHRVESVVLPTGWPAFDHALGGGLPRGIVTEIHGPEQSGKTRLVTQLAFRLREAGGAVALIDADRSLALDTRTEQAGQGFYCAPQSSEQAFDIMEALACSNAVDLIVVDSVAGLVSESEVAGNDAARPLANLLRRLRLALADTRTCVVFTRCSQGPDEFLDQRWAVGADWHALAQCAGCRVRVAAQGDAIRCTVIKSKFGPVPRDAVLRLG